MEEKARSWELVWRGGAKASQKRDQVSEGGVWVGVRGSERGTDSVPTLLITVSLETERGLPLALGNLLGPVAVREQRRREGGKGAEEGREEGKEGWN